jgi:hypothetical protein
MLLPAVNDSRIFGRLLAAHSRIELAHGNFEAAIKDYRNAMGLGRQLAGNDTLVACLTAVTLSDVCSARQIETFVQQPGAPNLYWALSNLPTPLVDFRDAVDAELHSVELTFPEVLGLEDADLTPAEWRARLLSLMEKAHVIADEKDWQPTAEYLDEAIPRILPHAKEYLADRGASPEAIEKMSAEQILLLDVVKRNTETREEAAKWFPLPYPAASQGLLAVNERTKQQWKERRDIVPLPQLSAGPLYACRRAQVRLDRRIAALRVLEALRIHAAAHGGQLPKLLTDVTEVPIPNDPVTEQPFEYILQGATAVLTGPERTDASRTRQLLEQHLEAEQLSYEISIAETR